MKVLSQSEIDLFEAQGYLRCKDVFSKEDALAMQAEIWKEFEIEFGIKQTKPETWRVPPHSPKKAKFSSLNEKVINKKFRGIIVEYFYQDSITSDSIRLNYFENKKYFEKDIFVIDSIN